MTTASTQRSRLRAMSATGFALRRASRPAAADGRLPAELAHGDFERRARAQRRLLEEHRDVAAAERVAVGAWRPSDRSALRRAPARGSARDRSASKSRIERKSLRVDVRSSSWSRSVVRVDPTYSALRSHVQTVDEAVPAPRSTDDLDLGALQVLGRARARTRRAAGRREQHDRSRSSRRPRATARTRRRRGRPRR